MSYRIFIAGVIVFASIVLVLWQKPETVENKQANPQLAQQPSPTQPVNPTATPMPTQVPTNTPRNTPTPNSPTQEIGTSNPTIYPGSELISDNGKQSVYTTTANAEDVGQWYKNRMQAEYNISNYVDLTANEEVTIKLTATNSTTSETLDVEITQSPGEDTTITIIQ